MPYSALPKVPSIGAKQDAWTAADAIYPRRYLVPSFMSIVATELLWCMCRMALCFLFAKQ